MYVDNLLLKLVALPVFEDRIKTKQYFNNLLTLSSATIIDVL